MTETQITHPFAPYQSQNIEHRLFVAEQALNKINEILHDTTRGRGILADAYRAGGIEQIITNWQALTT